MIWLLSRSVMIIACAVYVSATSRTNSVLIPAASCARRSRAPSLPTVAIGSGVPPSSFRLYAMLPAQPPKSRRSAGTRNDTFRMCSWSGRIWSAKRPSKIHDRVEREGTADERRHVSFLPS